MGKRESLTTAISSKSHFPAWLAMMAFSHGVCRQLPETLIFPFVDIKNQVSMKKIINLLPVSDYKNYIAQKFQSNL